MNKSKVYFTDLRAPVGQSQLTKLQRLIRSAGIGEIDMEKAGGHQAPLPENPGT